MRTALPLITVLALFCFVSNMDYLDKVKDEQHAKKVHKKVARLDAAEKARFNAELNNLAEKGEYMTTFKAGMK